MGEDEARIYPTLRSHIRNNSNPATEASMLVESDVAAFGENPSGRRREDDENMVTHTLRSEGFDASEDGTGRGTPLTVVSFAENGRGEVLEKETADSLKTGGGKPGQGYPAARVGGQVRRLTPTECERLMSWPDGWTVLDEVEGDPNPAPDSRRYAACGDGVVAHVAEWIARRLSPYVSAPDGRS